MDNFTMSENSGSFGMQQRQDRFDAIGDLIVGPPGPPGPPGEDAPDDYILVQTTQPSSETNAIWVDPSDETEVELPTWEEFSDLESATSIYNSLSGAIVSFNDGADAPVKSISIEGAASGVVYRTGKNILSDNYSGGAIRVNNGITFRNTDGAISVEGTSTADAYYGIAPNTDGQRIKLKAGTYTISCAETTDRCYLNFTIVGVLYSYLTGSTHSYTFSLATDAEMYANIRVLNNTTISTVLHPQIEVGFDSSGYEQYTGEAFNIPSESVTTLEGINNLWSYEGNVRLVYLANTKLYIDELDSKYADASREYAYSGAKIEIVPTLRYSKIAGISTGYTQGGACYGNYLFQFHSQNQGSTSNQGCSVVDLTTGVTVQFISLGADSLKHNNNASFGPQKYSDSDEFPLLYVSQENANARNCLVYRITGNVGEFTLSLIQTIVFPPVSEWSATYPNSCVGDDGYLYIVGSKPSNTYELLKYQLPAPTSQSVSLEYAQKLSVVPFTCPLNQQGFMVYDGKLYFTCGSASGSEMYVISAQTGETNSIVNFNSLGLNYEPEAVYLYNNYLHITFNTGGGTIYKFMF